MKLDATQLGRAEAQLMVEALPHDHPVMEKLCEVFGEHTFFIDSAGLHTIEPNPSPESTLGHVVKLASWSQDQTRLEVHEPEVQQVAVDLAADPPDAAS